MAPGRARNDRGWVTVWTVALSVAIFTVIAFTLDAGRVLRARSDAFGTAAAAARRGVQQIDERVEVEQGRTVLDEDAAVREALAYVEQRGYTGSAKVTGLEVTVTVEGDVDPHMLGVGTLHIKSTATAEAVQVGAP
jgi:Flp pilus assembly protein TadG